MYPFDERKPFEAEVGSNHVDPALTSRNGLQIAYRSQGDEG